MTKLGKIRGSKIYSLNFQARIEGVRFGGRMKKTTFLKKVRGFLKEKPRCSGLCTIEFQHDVKNEFEFHSLSEFHRLFTMFTAKPEILYGLGGPWAQ
ncbi:MAG: hypothetical protein QME66_04225 [Candidatus Eisenbacteria bacterium]|nr:hypothetical protein [Candidatus Eisenbacteria bacterium]